MDYIIYLADSNEFLRFSNGQIFLASDVNEVCRVCMDLMKEDKNPFIFSLNYLNIDGQNGKMQYCEIIDNHHDKYRFEFEKEFDFIYKCFYNSLEKFVNDYQTKHESKKNVGFYVTRSFVF